MLTARVVSDDSSSLRRPRAAERQATCTGHASSSGSMASTALLRNSTCPRPPPVGQVVGQSVSRSAIPRRPDVPQPTRSSAPQLPCIRSYAVWLTCSQSFALQLTCIRLSARFDSSPPGCLPARLSRPVPLGISSSITSHPTVGLKVNQQDYLTHHRVWA